jgi:hypothetical protein
MNATEGRMGRKNAAFRRESFAGFRSDKWLLFLYFSVASGCFLLAYSG